MPYVFRSPCNLKRRLISMPTQPQWESLLNYWAETYPFPLYTPEPMPGVSTPGVGTPTYREEYRAVLAIAQQYLGYSYSWGGKTPPYFDCSGFVAYCYKAAGIIPESVVAYTGSLSSYCVKVPDASRRPGDLVFWNGSNGSTDASNAHVGIYIGNDRIIDCAGSGVAYRPVTWHNTVLNFAGYYRPPKWMEDGG